MIYKLHWAMNPIDKSAWCSFYYSRGIVITKWTVITDNKDISIEKNVRYNRDVCMNTLDVS